MPDFIEVKDDQDATVSYKTHLTGRMLLSNSQLNKGRAFSQEERSRLKLNGILPHTFTTLPEQVDFYLKRLRQLNSNLEKNYFLNRLKQHNSTVFYRLAMTHIKEVLPILYTPTIGEAVKNFSYQFDLPRGLYLSYPERDNLSNIFDQVTHTDIKLIIITDGEAVLGIGDWGIGGMDICVGKLMVYTICGGINPNQVLPIQLDLGTNNQTLINDVFYKGWKHPRIKQNEYDEFISAVITEIHSRYPEVFLHWEDIGRDNAQRLLTKYREKICTFNDDIQGTGATATACILSWLKRIKIEPTEIRLIMFGAGSAGLGIVDHLVQTLIELGISKQSITNSIWLIDKQGLLFEDMCDLTESQKKYARRADERGIFNDPHDLTEILKTTNANAIIGCSAVSGAFTKQVVQQLCRNTKRPLIMPLSNPTSRCEAHPTDVVRWSKGAALIATGSPFEPVSYNGRLVEIAQCNNAYVFPGLGLGILASAATRVTDQMISAACQALAHYRSDQKTDEPLLPDFNDIQHVSKKIAYAVAQVAVEKKMSKYDINTVIDRVDHLCWEPIYLPIEQD